MFGTNEKLDRIKSSYVALFEEMVHPATSQERRESIVKEINDLAELTRIEMLMASATPLILEEEQ